MVLHTFVLNSGVETSSGSSDDSTSDSGDGDLIKLNGTVSELYKGLLLKKHGGDGGSGDWLLVVGWVGYRWCSDECKYGELVPSGNNLGFTPYT